MTDRDGWRPFIAVKTQYLRYNDEDAAIQLDSRIMKKQFNAAPKSNLCHANDSNLE